MSCRQKAAQLMNQRKRRNACGGVRPTTKPDNAMGNRRFRMTARGSRHGSPIASPLGDDTKKKTSGNTEKTASSKFLWMNRRTRAQRPQRWEPPVRRSLRSTPAEISSDEENQEIILDDQYPATSGGVRTRQSKASSSSTTSTMQTLRKTQRHLSSVESSEKGGLPFLRSRTKSHNGLPVVVEESSFDEMFQSDDSSASSFCSFADDEEKEAQERENTRYRLRVRKGEPKMNLFSSKSTDTEQGSRRASQRQRHQTTLYGKREDSQAKAHDHQGGLMVTSTPAITTRGMLKSTGQRLELYIYGSEKEMKQSRMVSLHHDTSRGGGTKRKLNNDDEEEPILQPVATRKRRCVQQPRNTEGHGEVREVCATRRRQRRLSNRLLPLREDQRPGTLLQYKPLLLNYESRFAAGMEYEAVHFGTSIATAEQAIQKATARFASPKDDPDIHADKLEYRRSLRSHSSYEDQEKLSAMDEDSVDEVVCEEDVGDLSGDIDLKCLAATPIMFVTRAHRGLKDLTGAKEYPRTKAMIPSICPIDTIRPETAKEALVELSHSIQFVTEFNSSRTNTF